MKAPPLGTSQEVVEYLNGLQPGERVMEMGVSCLTGCKGTVYHSTNGGGVCVRWDPIPPETGQMGTSATWGTRRIEDVDFGALIQSQRVLKKLVNDLPVKRDWLDPDLERIAKHLTKDIP